VIRAAKSVYYWFRDYCPPWGRKIWYNDQEWAENLRRSIIVAAAEYAKDGHFKPYKHNGPISTGE